MNTLAQKIADRLEYLFSKGIYSNINDNIMFPCMDSTDIRDTGNDIELTLALKNEISDSCILIDILLPPSDSKNDTITSVNVLKDGDYISSTETGITEQEVVNHVVEVLQHNVCFHSEPQKIGIELHIFNEDGSEVDWNDMPAHQALDLLKTWIDCLQDGMSEQQKNAIKFSDLKFIDLKQNR